MRIVILGPGKSRNAESGIARAVRSLGHEARLIDVVRLRQWLGPLAFPLIERLADSFEPDLVLASRHAWPLGALRLKRIFKGRRSAFWFHDPEPQPGVIDLARL